MTNPSLSMSQPLGDERLEPGGFQADQVFTIGGAHLVHDTYTSFLAPLLPLLQERLAVGYALAGGLTIFTQLPSLLNPFIGYLADKVSVRYFVILAPGITATLFSILGLAPDYLSLAMLLLAAGVSIAAFHAPAPAMIAKVAGQRVGAGMSIFMASGELARALGPILVVAGVGWFGLEGIWRLAVVGWMVSGILYWRLRGVAATPRAPGVSALAGYWATARRVFPPLAWLMAGRAFPLAALTTYLPLFMRDERDASLWLAAASLTILQAAGVAGSLLTGTLSDRLGRQRVLVVLTGVAPVLLVGFAHGPEWAMLPLLPLLGIAVLSPQPVMLALVQDHFPRNRAFANGTYLAISFLLQALAIWGVGFLADRWGLSMAFASSALLALLAIPAIFRLPERKD